MKYIKNVIAPILAIGILSSCATPPEPPQAQFSFANMVQETFQSIYLNNTSIIHKELSSLKTTATELLEKSDGKTSDNNVSRTSLLSYVTTIDTVLQQHDDLTQDRTAHEKYQRKMLMSIEELNARAKTVQDNMSQWENTREQIITESEDAKKRETENNSKRTELEKTVQNNAQKQRELERKRSAEQAQRQKDAEKRRKTAEQQQKKQEEANKIKREQDEERRKQEEFEKSVTHTINTQTSTTIDGTLTFETFNASEMKIGNIIKVTYKGKTTYYKITNTIVKSSTEEYDLTKFDVLFVKYTVDNETIIAGGEIVEP